MIEEDRKDFLFDPDCLSCQENLFQERLYTYDEVKKLRDELYELKLYFGDNKIKTPSNEKLVDEISSLQNRNRNIEKEYRKVLKGMKERLEHFSQISMYIRENNSLSNKLHYVERSLGLIAHNFDLPPDIKKNLLEYFDKEAYYRELIKSENELLKLNGTELSQLEFKPNQELTLKEPEKARENSDFINSDECIKKLKEEIEVNKDKIYRRAKEIIADKYKEKKEEIERNKNGLMEKIKRIIKK